MIVRNKFHLFPTEMTKNNIGSGFGEGLVLWG